MNIRCIPSGLNLLDSIRLIIVIILISSCNLKKNEKNDLIDFSDKTPVRIILDSSQTKKKLNECIADLSFVSLETKPTNSIGSIDKIIFFKNRFFILDRSFSSLKIFDENGKYLTSVGSLGRRPGQFTELQDFIIDSNKMHILLLSNDIMSTNEYKINGDYIRSKRNKTFAANFGLLNNKFYYYVSNNINENSEAFNLIITDSKGKILHKLFPIPKDMHMPIQFSGMLKENLKGLIYCNPLSDTIYQILPRVIYPKYIFDFSSSSLPPDARISMKEFFRSGKKYSFLENKIIESKQFISFSFQRYGKIEFAFFNKVKKRIVFNTTTSTTNDILAKVLEPPVGLIDGEKFISIIRPSKFFDFIKENKINSDSLEKDYPELSNVLLKLSPTDNPVIAIFNFKNN